MFDAIARRYDMLNHLLSAGLDRRWRRRAIRELRLAGHERVLDLCTGTGDLAIAAESLALGISGATINLRTDLHLARKHGADAAACDALEREAERLADARSRASVIAQRVKAQLDD